MLLDWAPLMSETCAPAPRFRAPAICMIHTVSGLPPASKRHAADNPGPESDCVGVHASESVCVCECRISYGGSHHGWRGDGVVRSVEPATDQSGGRELAAEIHRIHEARHGSCSDGANADVAGDLVGGRDRDRVRVR
eukprot:scaffold20408_cov54-Phaeocystis_antarctica.AAC.1